MSTRKMQEKVGYGVKSSFVREDTKTANYDARLNTWKNKGWVPSADEAAVYDNHASLYRNIVNFYKNINSRKSHLQTLVHHLKLDGRIDSATLDKYSDESTELNKQAVAAYKENIPVTGVTYEDIGRKMQEIETSDPMGHLLLSFLYHAPPLRTNDYLVYISDDIDNEGNHIFRTKRNTYKLVLNEYKTFPTYGRQVLNVPQKTIGRIIEKSLKDNPRGHLFVDEKGTPWTPAKYRAVLKKHLGVTQNQIRHIWVKWFMDQRPSMKEKERLAKSMLSSVAELETVYDQVAPKQPEKPVPAPRPVKQAPVAPPRKNRPQPVPEPEMTPQQKKAAYDKTRLYQKNRQKLLARLCNNPNSASEATLIKYNLNRDGSDRE